ncbi:MAG: tRNA (adenosine(37)-N6)-threonylcarbamoyltransferase complex transferase subunit TsaD [Candidatus Taylorbacteria bacterium]|nr:tRNA (adenosine(37)-N6)-threonylcarbamoyltransferase complex transferase subunit TsaD [Candidatus Taylorbacteria bacterium]
MIILGIETSCDETALSLIEINGGKNGSPQQILRSKTYGGKTKIKILGNEVLSQIALHKQYGGVFPMLAKREHAKNLIPLLKKVLEASNFLESRIKNQESRKELQNHSNILQNIGMILEREPELLKQFLEFIPTIERPPIDIIAVTAGPGLEPCLWTGLNFAKALSLVWNMPIIPVNHMEGHIFISLLKRNENVKTLNYSLLTINFPALALLISGGHTELVLIKDWLQYEVVGQTRDDALGEAFDKVARILGLPYPGGPEISALAERARKSTDLQLTRLPIGGQATYDLQLPRPMLKSDNFDFSFSGLKTAVLYLVKKLPQNMKESHPRKSAFSISHNPRLQMEIAREFEDAVTEVLVEKVKKAIELYGAETLILGGGVVANKNIRAAFENLASERNIILKLPAVPHATDNALMIALAGYFNRNKAVRATTDLFDLKANGNLHF